MGDLNLFQEIVAAYSSLCKLISMLVTYLHYPLVPFLLYPILQIAIAVLSLLALLPYWRIKDVSIKMSLALMPAFWVVIGAWGFVFRHRENSARWPNFIIDIPSVFVVLFFVYGIYLCIKNERHRLLTIVFFICNTFFLLMTHLYAVMSITGTWL